MATHSARLHIHHDEIQNSSKVCKIVVLSLIAFIQYRVYNRSIRLLQLHVSTDWLGMWGSTVRKFFGILEIVILISVLELMDQCRI